jgi:hypothetical protein
MRDIVVMLTIGEMMEAATTGCARHIKSVFDKRKGRARAEEEKGWQINIEGAAGEIALAKWRGEYWEAHIDNFDGGDVGKDQVRTTKHPGGHLILREKDRGDDIFYLLTGESPRFVIRGWILGREGKREKYFGTPNNRPKVWWVPQSELHEAVKEPVVSVFA